MSPTEFGNEKFARDIEFVMRALGEVLRDMGFSELLPYLPFVKQNPEDQSAALHSVPAHASRLVQLLSLSFQLLNMVEENVMIQQRRAVQAGGSLETESGLWPWTFEDLKEQGFSSEEIRRAVRRINVEAVLTAHPTESKRSTILEHHRDFYLLLVKRENQMWTPIEQSWLEEEMKAILERLWRTGEVFVERPDVSSEIRNLMHYLKNVFPQVLPWLDRRFKKSWQESGLQGTLDAFDGDYPKFQLGSWVGGDRDGHPFVTAQVTREALQELRLNALIVLRHKLIDLAKKLSIADQPLGVPKILTERLAEYQRTFPDLHARAVARNPHESLRILIEIMVERLPIEVIREHATHLREQNSSYQRPSELKDDLSVLAGSLRSLGAQRLETLHLQDVVRLLETYGFHTARLDIRQNSRFHDLALQHLLEIAGVPNAETYEQWSHHEKSLFLQKELQNARPFTLRTQVYEKQACDVMDCLEVLLQHRRQYGCDGIGSYIVSMTHSADDLFTTYLLMREAGLTEFVDKQLVCPIPVVPLFETIADLESSVDIIDSFLAHPITQASLIFQQSERGFGRPRQQIMVGYSDSCKDGGLLASQWHLYQAQSRLSETAERHGVELCFFHGRGGTVSRGAGPVHRFMQSLPPKALSGSFRMTEQGETIARKYANHATAVYNMELLIASVAAETLKSPKKIAAEPWVNKVMEQLSGKSLQVYRGLVTRPDFVQFFRQATPVDALEHSRMGSRPSKRTGQSTLDDLRAIPWVFAWNQSRFYLPSWFGVGSALRDFEQNDQHHFSLVQERLDDLKLLNYLMHNVETTVASASEEIMLAYAELVDQREVRHQFMEEILSEFHCTRDMLIKLFGSSIENRRPNVVRTISLREQSLRLLHRVQIYQLKEWRKCDPNDTQRREMLLQKLFATINAIAGGLRNTG